jgi:acetate kinase
MTRKTRPESSDVREVNTINSPVKILVLPTNEELEIVKQCDF